MITWGALILAVNLIFLGLCIFVGFIVSSITENRKIGFVVFLIILLAPFWDLIIQKSIKIYYQAFDTETKIYAYPEFNKNGKIESLGIYKNLYGTVVGRLKSDKERERLKSFYKVEDFIEIYFKGTFSSYKENLGYTRVYFNKTPITYEKINGTSNFKSRYQIKGFENNNYFYTKTNIEFWDIKKNKLLMKAIRINFYKKKFNDNFRNKYLLWKTANGVNLVYVMPLSTFSNISRVFKNVIIEN